MMAPLNGRDLGSVIVYSLTSGLGLGWLLTLVIIPMLSVRFEYTIQAAVSFGFDLLITALVLVAILHNGLHLINMASRGVSKPRGEARFSRFSLNQRIQHLWLIAPVVVLALTGFAQMHYESWGRLIIAPMGGLQVNMNLHLTAAFLLGVLIVYHFVFHTVEYVARRARGLPAQFDIMFGRKDVSDFLKNLRYMAGGREGPKFNKYSYMQKFDYWGIYWGILILGIPGLILWAYGYTFLWGLPFIFHVKEAMLAVLWLLLFHFYQTHFNPRNFPINNVFLSGYVTEQEMIEEHPLELERLRVRGEIA